MKEKHQRRRPEAAECTVLACVRNQWLKTAPEGRVILAVSGGVDSVTLLEAAARVVPDRSRLLVAHVNHGLRGDESRGDASLVRDRTRELGIPFTETLLDWRGQTATQSSCRARRDDFFRSLLRHPSDRVWLAHHLNDQAETVFFRLLRGTGARGLRGMLPENGFKVRPFLGVEKRVLVAAAEAFGASWREDSSNLDPAAYERNWLRSFFPVLEARRPRFQQKLAALAAEAQAWPLPATRFDSFQAAPGVTLHRLRGEAPVTRVLAEEFALSRLHATRLRELLLKGSGEWHAERARFAWSGGVLLCERSGSRLDVAFSSRGRSAEGTLGVWELPDGAAFFAPRKGGGDSRKKELQALRVPRFLRAGVPLVEWRGRTRALLPSRFPGLPFTPSPLAAWWLRGN